MLIKKALSTVGEIMTTPDGEALTRQMFGERCAVAQRGGYAISADEQDKALVMLTQKGSALTAPMLRDQKSGQQTEHEDILGDMVRRGQQAGLPLELVRIAYTHLAVQVTRRKG